MNAHVNARDGGAKCEEVMARMRKEGVEPDVTSWTTLMNAHVNARDGGAKCEEVMARMRKEGVEPNVTSWTTLMNAHVNARDGGAKCEEVMARMRKEGVEPDVTSWTSLIQSYKVVSDGDGSLVAFRNMLAAGIRPNSFTLSSLFSALSCGLAGNRSAGCRKIVELSREHVTDHLLNHHVASALLRAVADVGSESDVNALWQRCARCLGPSREGWPGSSAEFLDGLSQRIGCKGQWPLIGRLVASAQPPSHAVSHGAVVSRPSASGSRAAPRCKFFHEQGQCRKGSSCPFTH
jgi:pentatricopeptide repeat protein